MTQTQELYAAELEHQELIKQAHCLITTIASHTNSIKILRVAVQMLQSYADYKINRKW